MLCTPRAAITHFVQMFEYPPPCLLRPPEHLCLIGSARPPYPRRPSCRPSRIPSACPLACPYPPGLSSPSRLIDDVRDRDHTNLGDHNVLVILDGVWHRDVGPCEVQVHISTSSLTVITIAIVQ